MLSTLQFSLLPKI